MKGSSSACALHGRDLWKGFKTKLSSSVGLELDDEPEVVHVLLRKRSSWILKVLVGSMQPSALSQQACDCL